MIDNNIELCAMTADALAEVSFRKPFSAWIHCSDGWTDRSCTAISLLVTNGCRYIMMSGERTDDLHDKADDLAVSLTNELVLTTARSNIDGCTAFEFLSTRCPQVSISGMRIVLYLSQDSSVEIDGLRAMLSGIREALDNA